MYSVYMYPGKWVKKKKVLIIRHNSMADCGICHSYYSKEQTFNLGTSLRIFVTKKHVKYQSILTKRSMKEQIFGAKKNYIAG